MSRINPTETLLQFSREDLRDTQSLELVLNSFRQAIQSKSNAVSQEHIQSALSNSSLAYLNSLAAQLSPFIKQNLQATGFTTLNITNNPPNTGTGGGGGSGGGGGGTVLLGTHSTRLSNFVGSNQPGAGTLFFETDRTALYISANVGGSLQWEYISGQFVSTFANEPNDLGSTDTGFEFYATDQDTVYIWTGAAFDTISRRILLGGFNAIFTHANTADRTYTYLNGSGKISLIADTVALTNQSADIAATNFNNVITPGTYRSHFSMECTTADGTAGSIIITYSWTDDAGAGTQTQAQVLNVTGRTFGTVFLQAASGNVTWGITHTGIYATAKYSLYLSFERLS